MLILFILSIIDIYNLMKKKAQEKKQIVSCFEPQLFWQYEPCTPQNIQKIDTFVNNFSNQLKALILPENSLEQNYAVLCEKAGYTVHPSLTVKSKEESKFPHLKSNDFGDKFAVFLSHRIDIVTLKIFGFLIQNYKINTLKFSNNCLEAPEVDQIKKIIEREDQLTTLYFEWNPIPEHPQRKDVFLACVRPSLHHLVLRQCHLGDQATKELIKKVKEIPEGKLKSLDLYGNKLTPAIIEDISCFVEESKTIEFLGLSKNGFSSEDCLSKLLGSIGQIPLSEEQFEQHKLKEKERDEVIEKNKKRKKGAPQQPVPFVFDVKQTANGRVYVKNTSLKILNLATNTIKDSCSIMFRKFLESNGKGLQLFIEGNKFSKGTKETFKFFENVIC